jgi:hypothetical protein
LRLKNKFLYQMEPGAVEKAEAEGKLQDLDKEGKNPTSE